MASRKLGLWAFFCSIASAQHVTPEHRPILSITKATTICSFCVTTNLTLPIEGTTTPPDYHTSEYHATSFVTITETETETSMITVTVPGHGMHNASFSSPVVHSSSSLPSLPSSSAILSTTGPETAPLTTGAGPLETSSHAAPTYNWTSMTSSDSVPATGTTSLTVSSLTSEPLVSATSTSVPVVSTAAEPSKSATEATVGVSTTQTPPHNWTSVASSVSSPTSVPLETSLASHTPLQSAEETSTPSPTHNRTSMASSMTSSQTATPLDTSPLTTVPLTGTGEHQPETTLESTGHENSPTPSHNWTTSASTVQESSSEPQTTTAESSSAPVPASNLTSVATTSSGLDSETSTGTHTTALNSTTAGVNTGATPLPTTASSGSSGSPSEVPTEPATSSLFPSSSLSSSWSSSSLLWSSSSLSSSSTFWNTTSIQPATATSPGFIGTDISAEPSSTLLPSSSAALSTGSSSTLSIPPGTGLPGTSSVSSAAPSSATASTSAPSSTMSMSPDASPVMASEATTSSTSPCHSTAEVPTPTAPGTVSDEQCPGTQPGDMRRVVLRFDDIGGEEPVSLSDEPYHRFYFSKGFEAYPGWASPFLPTSGNSMLRFKGGRGTASELTGGRRGVGYVGMGPHTFRACNRFNMRSLRLGCQSNRGRCVFRFMGRRAASGTRERTVARYRVSFRPCRRSSFFNCRLRRVRLPRRFRDLTSIWVVARSRGRRAVWWADDMRMKWTDSSCIAAQCRAKTSVPATLPTA